MRSCGLIKHYHHFSLQVIPTLASYLGPLFFTRCSTAFCIMTSLLPMSFHYRPFRSLTLILPLHMSELTPILFAFHYSCCFTNIFSISSISYTLLATISHSLNCASPIKEPLFPPSCLKLQHTLKASCRILTQLLCSSGFYSSYSAV